jgi:hypothetical protein
MLPTIVNNVETVSNLPHILAMGAGDYAGLAHESDTGTFLISLSGHVVKPGNYELPHGITWRELIYDVGGGIPDGKELKAWIPGGASAPWFVPEHLDLEITKIGALSDALAPWAGADSLRYALTIALLSCFLAAGAYAYAAATVRRAATSEVGFSDLRTLERERKAGIS